MKEAYPQVREGGIDGDKSMEIVMGVIGAVRNLRSEMNIKPSVVIKEVSLFISEEKSVQAYKGRRAVYKGSGKGRGDYDSGRGGQTSRKLRYQR